MRVRITNGVLSPEVVFSPMHENFCSENSHISANYFWQPGIFLSQQQFLWIATSPDIQGRGRHHHGFWSLLSTTRRSPARGKSFTFNSLPLMTFSLPSLPLLLMLNLTKTKICNCCLSTCPLDWVDWPDCIEFTSEFLLETKKKWEISFSCICRINLSETFNYNPMLPSLFVMKSKASPIVCGVWLFINGSGHFGVQVCRVAFYNRPPPSFESSCTQVPLPFLLISYSQCLIGRRWSNTATPFVFFLLILFFLFKTTTKSKPIAKINQLVLCWCLHQT